MDDQALVPNGYREASSEGLTTANMRVLQYGLQRSGSTFIYQVLADYFPEGGVIRTHNYLVLPASVPVIVSFRDFRDCVVSHWRLENPERKEMTTEEVFFFAGIYRRAIWYMEQYLHRRNPVLILRYEDWHIDPVRYLCEPLEAIFSLGHKEDRRQAILQRHSLEENRRLSWGETPPPPETNLMVRHVHEGEPGSWKRFLSSENALLLTDLLADYLRKHHYL